MPASRSASERWGRRLLAAALLLLSWAGFLAASGGFLIDIGVLRISSRNPTRVAAAGILLVLAAWRLAYREQVRRAALSVPGLLTRTELRFAAMAPRFAHLSRSFAWTSALALLVLAILYGSRVAGGADASVISARPRCSAKAGSASTSPSRRRFPGRTRPVLSCRSLTG